MYLLGQWLTGFKLLGIPNISRENVKFKLFFRVHWLSDCLGIEAIFQRRC